MPGTTLLRGSFSLMLLATPLLAQTRTGARADRWIDDCRDRSRRDRAQVCEVRNSTPPVTASLTVDGRENGGATVRGWDKKEIQVTAMIQASADSQDEAQDLAKQITVSTDGGRIRADGPSARRRQSWSVSYEIWAPRNTALSMTASNGGLGVEGINARVDLETTNGGLSLRDVGGDVRGSTVNGGVSVDLDGVRWEGAGLDVRTTNGGVNLSIPTNYSARLETGTVNGGMNIDFPITVQGIIGRRLTTQLGAGGATLRVTTTNGGVTIGRR
jgi:DUF4097 and DUF4098 domain-containing protein YvlB